MMKNLKLVLRQKGIGTRGLAQIIGASESSAQNKLNETTDFTYKEYKAVCAALCEYNADYLFQSDSALIQ